MLSMAQSRSEASLSAIARSVAPTTSLGTTSCASSHSLDGYFTSSPGNFDRDKVAEPVEHDIPAQVISRSALLADEIGEAGRVSSKGDLSQHRGKLRDLCRCMLEEVDVLVKRSAMLEEANEILQQSQVQSLNPEELFESCYEHPIEEMVEEWEGEHSEAMCVPPDDMPRPPNLPRSMAWLGGATRRRELQWSVPTNTRSSPRPAFGKHSELRDAGVGNSTSPASTPDNAAAAIAGSVVGTSTPCKDGFAQRQATSKRSMASTHGRPSGTHKKASRFLLRQSTNKSLISSESHTGSICGIIDQVQDRVVSHVRSNLSARCGLHPAWNTETIQSPIEPWRDSRKPLHGAVLDDKRFNELFLEATGESNEVHRLTALISPMSRFNLCWAAVLVVLVFYDFVSVPLEAFEPEDTQFRAAMVWITRMFWTITIPITMITGYVKVDGSIEMQIGRVFRHYAKTWLAFDILVVLADWIAFVVASASDFARVRVVIIARLVRVMRILRLGQALKLPALYERISARSYFEKAKLWMGIVETCVVMMCIAHVIACLWYAIGKNGWVQDIWTEPTHESFGLRYTISLHWAITQFQGNNEIYPTSLLERAFAVVFLSFGFFAAGGFVSKITADITHLSIISSKQGRQLAVLRQYVDYHKMSHSLSLRVVKGATHMLAQQERNIREQDIELLRVLSRPLLVEIHYEVNVPILTAHPFFRGYHHWNPIAMRKVCDVCVQMISLHAGDILFTEGERPAQPKMFFVTNGKLLYIRQHAARATLIIPRMWACEMSLWVDWVHQGSIRAGTNSLLMTLDAKKFQAVATEFQQPGFFPAMYANVVHDILQTHTGIDDVNYGEVDLGRVTARIFPTHLSRQPGQGSLTNLLRSMSGSSLDRNSSIASVLGRD